MKEMTCPHCHNRYAHNTCPAGPDKHSGKDGWHEADQGLANLLDFPKAEV